MAALVHEPSNQILDQYRYRPGVPEFLTASDLKGPSGYFRFGPNLVCYGQAAGVIRSNADDDLFDAFKHVRRQGGSIVLPFNPDQVFENLRYERYVSSQDHGGWAQTSWARDIYYRLRPLLPISVRKRLQKIYLRGWDAIPFPNWPVDRSVDSLFETLLVLAMEAMGIDEIPFIWFWPNGHKSCAIMTHDVETTAGRNFSETLMDIDDAFGIKASFQIVPEKRYAVPSDYLETIRERGFEINVQGLDHKGNLFQDRKVFLECARKINHYAQLYGSRGFRSPVLYRNIDWFRELKCSYDMSVPNVARLEAQRGGCCTLFPFFLPGGMVELPLTTTEDYTLFHILEDYSTGLWKKQLAAILKGHGLMSFIVHPDYIIQSNARKIYAELLEEICRLRSDHDVWVTLPREVDRWWRQRSQMTLVAHGKGWRIEGAGSDRARTAHGRLDGGRLVYQINPD